MNYNYDQENGQNKNPQNTTGHTPTADQTSGSQSRGYQQYQTYQNPTTSTTPHTASSSDNLYQSSRPAPGATPTEQQPIYASSRANYQSDYGHTTQTAQTHSYSAPPNPHENHNRASEATKKKSRAPFVIGILAACAILSTSFSFLGTALANGLQDGDPLAQSGETSVITQSVVNSSTNNTDISAVVASTENSVVEITTEVVQTGNFMQQYVSTGAGSGVIISEDGYIVTNNHVVEGASDIQVKTKLGQTYQAQLIGTDPATDLAVLKIEATGLTPAVFGDSDNLVVGETAIAIGNPLGTLGGTVTSGIVSALDRQITIEGQTMTLLQTSAAVNPGNSGGGLFNSQGELIGVVNSKSGGDVEGLGFAIPSNVAQEVVADLIENGYVTGKTQLGVSVISIADEQTAAMYGVQQQGIYIAQITPNSDAYYGGLQVGDLVKTINGTAITETSQVKDMVSDAEVGDVLQFVVVRNGQEQTVSITLTEYNPNAQQFAEAFGQ